MDALRVDVQERAGATVVRLDGQASIMTEDAIKRLVDRLRALHPKRIVLDLAKLTFISSLAIGLFVSLERDLKTHGGQVAIAAANNDVGKVIQRCRLDTIMPVYESVDQAMG
ncbi:MAG: STAS domain-containing protein [Phycisphaerae bacterium]|nr:STAS domain-containing protein [Phycisphaerae bacterium]